MLHVHPCHKEQLHCPKNPMLSHPPLRSPPPQSHLLRNPPPNPRLKSAVGSRLRNTHVRVPMALELTYLQHSSHHPPSAPPMVWPSTLTPGHPSHVSARAAVGNAAVNIRVQGSLGHTWSDPGVNAEACGHWTVHRAHGWFWKKPQAPPDTATPFCVSSSHL